jgi:hypothetical protein
MSDWYLGQAGFGEQIGLYNESFWRQVGSALVWASVVIWLVLIAVAIVITLSRQAEATEEMDSDRRFFGFLRRTHAKPLGPRPPKRRGILPPDSSGRAA